MIRLPPRSTRTYPRVPYTTLFRSARAGGDDGTQSYGADAPLRLPPSARVRAEGFLTMPVILWLASYPKSGNTWMRAFLANLILDHPEPLPLKRMGEVCPSEPTELWFRPFTKKKIADLTSEEVAALRVKAQERAVSLNKNVVPMKTHSYLGEDHGHPIIDRKSTRLNSSH